MIQNPVIQGGGTDIETCTLTVGKPTMTFGSVFCLRLINGEIVHWVEPCYLYDGPGEITDIIKGSLVIFARDSNSDNPNSSGYLHLETSPHRNDGCDANLIPVTEEGSGIFKIIGDVYVEDICCFVKGTRISVHSGGYKLVEDITYDDELLAWDFDNGRFTYNKPCWIKKEEVASHYYKCTFSNGTELKLVGSAGKCHRVFSIDDNEFLSATDCVGKHVATKDGLAILLSCECVNDPVEFYNIITERHMNLFAENVLTSCRLNNLYPIQDMKFVKDDRPAMPIDRYSKVAQKYYDALRLGERDEDDIAWVNAYVERIDSISDAQKLRLRNKQS